MGTRWYNSYYDRYIKCAICGEIRHYNASNGGRPPKYCEKHSAMLDGRDSRKRRMIRRYLKDQLAAEKG